MNAAASRLGAVLSAVPRARLIALAAGLVTILAMAAVAGWLVLRPSYEILFSDLKRQDAATIAAALEKEKIPYRYDDASSAILVPKGDTRALRLKLMSRDLKLSGAVGLELFNNSDLGLTDFAQKVNYQRALQGELARTIMALDEIELARVHITLPEASIFRRDGAKPKASVALFVRDGETLSTDTIRGIQRLVSASVPELAPADVSVLDARGAPAGSTTTEVDDPALQLKHAIERGYEQKITTLIASVIGANQASVSVEAIVNVDQARSTREVTETRSLPNDAESAKESRVPLPSSRSLPEAGKPPLPPPYTGSAAQPMTQEARTMRNVEQIVKAPGAVSKLSVGIVFSQDLDPDVLARLRAVISASIGLDATRGDVLTTFVRNAQGGSADEDAGIPPANVGSATSGSTEPLARADLRSAGGRAARQMQASAASLTAIVCAALAVVIGIGLVIALLIRARAKASRAPVPRLTASQRDEQLSRLRTLLASEGRVHE
ncbi:flagellar MS-ring protein [Caballeronia pedi]|uniref:Flagellar M-ring protein n=1 Tax=Caballeronia pedi TaxID=1777141 RepID=A0A158C1T6_9BURK|nr:flagellar basal-body MS-ring/collar protein FliF [Caballeronia pedi]SAK75856.1 flagellar MS-ring protein [Caballeronia pedi]